MPDYSKGKIYKLWSPSKNLVYYGSTTQTISQRLQDHVRTHKVYNIDNTKKYCSSYFVLDCEDYKIELLEEYPCNNKTQLCKKEGEYQKANECVNKNINGRTVQEWNYENREKRKIQKKEYNEKNKELIKEQQKKYNKKNADKIKEQTKKYYYNNRDKIIEQRKNKAQLKKSV